MKRKLPTLLALLLLIGGGAAAWAGLPAGLDPQPQHRDPYDWDARHEAVKQYNAEKNPDTVVIGDSITHHWGGEPSLGGMKRGAEAWEKLFGTASVTNMGFGFDYIDNAYYRIEHDELGGATPRTIIILLGTNNLGHRHDSPRVCAENMQALLKLLQRKSPKSRILLLGVLPRREAELAKPIAATNRLYSRLADNKRVFFRDIGKALAAPGSAAGAPTANPAYFRDVVHPNKAGYEVIAAELSKILEKLPNN